jgi:hypothetical protein
MKYIISILAVIALTTSCRKDGKYTCTCTDDSTGANAILPVPYAKNVSKKKAQSNCDDRNTQYENSNIAVTCKLLY